MGSNNYDLLTMTYVEILIDILLTIAFLIPSIIIITRFKQYMDSFSKWMIIFYNIGFLCKCNVIDLCIVKVLFTGFEIYILDESDSDWRSDSYIVKTKALSSALIYMENSIYVVAFSFFVFKL